METTANLTNMGNTNIPVKIVYQNAQLIFYWKSGMARTCFGVVGEALSSEKERLRINFSDVKQMTTRKTWTGKQDIQLVTDEDTYIITFRKDDRMAEVLKRDLSARAL